jgi:hypothetical protein
MNEVVLKLWQSQLFFFMCEFIALSLLSSGYLKWSKSSVAGIGSSILMSSSRLYSILLNDFFLWVVSCICAIPSNCRKKL